MKMKLPEYVIKVIDALIASGFEAYIVGGAVRDLLLEKEPDDYDIATNARPDEIKIVGEKNGFATAGELGQNFGVECLL